MKQYISDNPALSASAIVKEWAVFNEINSNMVFDQSSRDNYISKTKSADPKSAADRHLPVQLSSKEYVYVSSQWTADRVQLFADKLAEMHWPYSIKKADD